MTVKALVFSALGFLLFSSNVLSQEDYPFIPEELPPHLAARVSIQQEQLLLSAIEAPSEYFIAGLKRWDTRQPIKVCFFGGSNSLRSEIARIAMQWSQVSDAYVPLDFGSLAAPRACSGGEFNHIRIGFAYRGYWSMVGTDSVNAASQLEQSMNFYLFDVNPPRSQQLSQIVLHEFGHALGFQHEHQSPSGSCEFDWEKVYAYLAGSPNFWSKEQIDHNMRPRPATAGVLTSPQPDTQSVMLYSFPRDFYRSGAASQCFTPGNFTISEMDKAGLRKVYPASAQAALAVTEGALQEFYLAVDALTLPDLGEADRARAKVFASTLSEVVPESWADRLVEGNGTFNSPFLSQRATDFLLGPDVLNAPVDYLGSTVQSLER